MRSNIVSVARSCLIGFVAAGMINLPLMAANSKPLGMIVIADHAKVDTSSATVGANLFPGDAVLTDANGSLRMSIGPSQVYLLSSTAATLVPGQNRVQAKLTQGTLGFSTTSPDQLEIGTPLVVIRGASGARVFAQVAVLSPTKLQISAFEGSLIATSPDGEQKVIDEGQTYEASVAAPEPGGGQNQYGVGHSGINWKHVAFVAAVAGTMGAVAWVLWHEEEESCITPPIRHTDCDNH